MTGSRHPPAGPVRHAIVGTGARAEMYTRALADGRGQPAVLVALCDTNATRLAAHNAVLAELAHPPVPAYPAHRFAEMLSEQAVQRVIVSSVDSTHHHYIVNALEAGCDVITEKPMTVDAGSARRILEAVDRTGRSVTVAFNYRYNPIHHTVWTALRSGAIGDIGSVHFEWLLDTRHGADYFRRWHRDKANSGGLMVHKASHHFDLVNWWLGSQPETVFGIGSLFFYGENGRRRGLDRGYPRAHQHPAAGDDPYALDLASRPRLRALYLDAEFEDGYHRDQSVFGPGVTIEDDMAVAVRYRSGASMTYHLTAYSPWEGYRIAFNGSAGRLELTVTESAHTGMPSSALPEPDRTSAVLHGTGEQAVQAKLLLRPLWKPPAVLELPAWLGDHGGGDQRMLADLFAAPSGDGAGQRSDARDGARALLTGLAANESFRTGAAVAVDDILTVPDPQ